MTDNDILVFGAPAEADKGNGDVTLAIGRVPTKAIARGLRKLMIDVDAIVTSAGTTLTRASLTSIDLQVAIGLDGSVGLLATNVSSNVAATMTLHLTLSEQDLGAEES